MTDKVAGVEFAGLENDRLCPSVVVYVTVLISVTNVQS